MTAPTAGNSVPCIPDNAPFTPAQRAWLNGFLAGIYSAAEAARSQGGTPMEPAKVTLKVLFGSETGNCEAIAKRVARTAQKRGFDSKAMGLDKVLAKDLTREKYALIITSTFGDGEPPENAKTFHAELHGSSQPRLENLSYAVLALGDKNYERFCKCGIDFDTRLEALGARRFYERFDCDVDYEADFQRWEAGVFGVLEAMANSSGLASSVNAREMRAGRARTGEGEPGLSEDGRAVLPDRTSDTGSRGKVGPQTVNGAVANESHGGAGDVRASRPIEEPVHSRKNPFAARLLGSRRLTDEGSAKETWHFEISLENSGLSYEVGDAFGVLPINCPALVDELLHLLRADGKEVVPAPEAGEVSLRTALLRHYEITKIPALLLNAIAERSSDRMLADLLKPEAKEKLAHYLWGREIVDLLTDFASATFTPADFLSHLRNLQPRLYSIASSLKAHPGRVHLTVATVRYQSHGRLRKGVCSTFLADRASGSVPVFVQASHNFRLPESGATPIIMVGPGTGVAPFRAFLHERQAVGASGGNWLFFGEQRAGTDFYYRDELEAMMSAGHLARLSTAFSRDQEEKIYVQNRILEEGAHLWRWLQDGAHFYVCGDASRMAKDVERALLTVVETHGGLNKDAAAEYVQKLKIEKRYQRDIY